MAIVYCPLLSALMVSYSQLFEEAKSKAPSQWSRVATLAPSNSASSTYGWLGQFPRLAEWTGTRAFKNIREFGYSIVNKKYEASVRIPRTAFEDDTLGIYAPLFQEMGYAAATHPDEIIFTLLKKGKEIACYDGKMFFAKDHPVFANVAGTGNAENASNLIEPEADPQPAWYLLEVSRPLKPFIFHERTKPKLETITSTTNDTVFNSVEYPFGVQYRCDGGYRFWQLAVISTEKLDAVGFEKALLTLQSFKADCGRPMGCGFGGKEGTLLVALPSQQAAARHVVVSEIDAAGASNI